MSLSASANENRPCIEVDARYACRGSDSSRWQGRESIEDEPRSGRPAVSKAAENVVRVRDLVRSDRRLTVRMIGEELNLNHTTVHQILTNELKTRKICAKMVPENPFSGNRFLASKNIPVAPQPLYSPDLSLVTFSSFRN
ncbi:uncharacterized protein TNCV_1433721 [Trichonephila clavipes]|nr:uncharacterized protein TNCV_1433721 [Trichonephila clavipes]